MVEAKLGVIDWHEASIRPLACELASATFELCSDEEHRFHFDRADAFIAAYLDAGGPTPTEELAALLPLIRLWLRDDARFSLAYDVDDDDYAEKQMAAFVELRDCRWQPACL